MCANAGQPVAMTRIIPCKVPLSAKYQVPEELLFTPSTLIAQQASLGRSIGLVIDLTNSDRYYDGVVEFVERGVEYVRIREEGHSVVPKRASVAAFCRTAADFLRKHPQKSLRF